MKSYLPHASILTVLILLAMPGFNSTARVHRAPQMPPQQAAPRLPGLTSPSKLSQEAPPVQVPENCRHITPDVQRHGGKGYVIEPSPTLAQYLKNQMGKTKGYGEEAIDKKVVDSFKLKNCRVCHATIEYRASHNGKGWEVDTFVAAIAPFTDGKKYFLTPPYKCHKGNLIGCIWDKSDKKSKTVTLKIEPSALAALNTYLATGPMPTYLDIRGDDDTAFDYVTLRVWYY